MKSRVLRSRRGCDSGKVDELILGGEPATLRVVVTGDAVLQKRLALDVPVDLVDEPIPVVLKAQVEIRIEVLARPDCIFSEDVRPEPRRAPPGS
jgi:hypothetical protein